jgi:hypothetical protein
MRAYLFSVAKELNREPHRAPYYIGGPGLVQFFPETTPKTVPDDFKSGSVCYKTLTYNDLNRAGNRTDFSPRFSLPQKNRTGNCTKAIFQNSGPVQFFLPENQTVW